MTPSTNTVRTLLLAHHNELAEACKSLLSRAFADDPRTLVAEFRRFEAAVLAHIDAEEEAILPAYADAAPDDARLLGEEHEMFRKLLLEIGVDVELHAIRADHIAVMIDRLTAHAAHEERGMYLWAERQIAPALTERLTERLTHSLRTLAARARPSSLAEKPAERTHFSR